MTATEVKTYLEETYGECKHDEYAMAEAVNQTREDMDHDNEWDLFHLLYHLYIHIVMDFIRLTVEV